MCHSATARPTHGVVGDRAVFVPWNPPTTTRSRTRTGCVFCFSHFAVPCVMRYSSSVAEASPPDLPTKLVLRVPATAKCRRPPAHQGRPPSSFCGVGARAPSAQGRVPSPPGSPTMSCRIAAIPARVVPSGPPRLFECHPSTAVPAKVALFARARAPSQRSLSCRPRQGRPPSPSGSLFARPLPDRLPSCFGECHRVARQAAFWRVSVSSEFRRRRPPTESPATGRFGQRL